MLTCEIQSVGYNYEIRKEIHCPGGVGWKDKMEDEREIKTGKRTCYTGNPGGHTTSDTV